MSASATSNGDRRAFGGYPNAGYPTAQPLSTAAGTSAYAAPVSARLVNAPMPSGERLPDPGEQASLSASVSSTGGPVLRKRLFDQNVSDWASRYRKHKQGLDQVTRDCDLLRSEVSKHQVEVNEQAQKLADLEDKHENHTLAKFAEAKSALEVAGQRKQQLALEVGEARKMKAQLAKECKLLKADYERKHSELARGAEMRDRLEQQLMSYTQQLNQVSSERQRLEKELELVQHNLRQHTELADEAHSEIERTCGGIKDSVQHHSGSCLLNPPTTMFNCCLSEPETNSEEVAVRKDVRLNTNESERNDSPNSEGAQKRRPSIRTKQSEGYNSEIHEVYEHDKDHLEWLNMSLKHLWPEMSEAARAVAVGKVLPSIKAKLLAKGKGAIYDVKFSEFTLGSQPVVLGPIQVSRMPRGSVRVRVLLDYRSDMHVEMELDTSYGRWCFGMRDFRIVGEMVTRVRPHIPDSPGTGSVSVFFVDPPKVDFTFSGNMSFGNFPFVKEAIRHSVDSLIAEMFVLPNVATQHISLTDLKMYPLVFSSPVPVGILRVTLQETVLESKIVEVASEEKSPSKKKAGTGILSRMFSPFTKAFKGVLYAWEETEEFIERQVGAVIGVTTEPYMKWQLGQQVWMPDFKPGASFNFAMYDPEQHVKVSLWDRDLLSKDDLMGETTFQAVKAIFHSGERVPLIVPGEEDLSAGTFNAKIEFLVTSPGHNSSEGYLVVIRVREFLQGGSALKGKKLAMRAVFGDEQQITKAGAAMLDITETIPAKAMLKKIEENMNEAGVDEEAIQKVLDLESLRQCSFAINRSLHFVVANHEIEEGEVSLHLVDMDIVQQKKGKDKKESPRSPRSPRASEADEEVVGSMKISLKQLYEAEGLEIGGPFEFDAKELGKIDVKMHVHLSGLEPTSLETVNKMAVDEDKMAAEVEEILQEM